MNLGQFILNVADLVLGDKFLALAAYIFGVMAGGLTAWVFWQARRKWAVLLLAFLVGLLAAAAVHNGWEVARVRWITPLAPHLNLY